MSVSPQTVPQNLSISVVDQLYKSEYELRASWYLLLTRWRNWNARDASGFWGSYRGASPVLVAMGRQVDLFRGGSIGVMRKYHLQIAIEDIYFYVIVGVSL